MLSESQVEQLLAPLNLSRVHTSDKVYGEYLEHQDVRAHLIRIFGFGGWDKQITYTREYLEPGTDRKTGEVKGWDCSYSAHCRITIKDAERNIVSVHEDAGAGESLNQSTAGAAIDLALKAAVSDALKRACVDLGNQFGLSLYVDKKNGQVCASIVARSLAHMDIGAADWIAVAEFMGKATADGGEERKSPPPASSSKEPDPPPAPRGARRVGGGRGDQTLDDYVQGDESDPGGDEYQRGVAGARAGLAQQGSLTDSN